MALHFELVTPAKLVRSEDVYMVVVPGTEGRRRDRGDEHEQRAEEARGPGHEARLGLPGLHPAHYIHSVCLRQQWFPS